MSATATDQALLRVRDLKVHFPIYGGVLRKQVGTVKAVDGVSFDLQPGEVLGLVGDEPQAREPPAGPPVRSASCSSRPRSRSGARGTTPGRRSAPAAAR